MAPVEGPGQHVGQQPQEAHNGEQRSGLATPAVTRA